MLLHRATIVLILATLAYSMHFAEHEQTGSSNYKLLFEGRTMKVNECYNLLKDKETIFLIHPNDIIIKACNIHVCEY